jgi:hypothetical protein
LSASQFKGLAAFGVSLVIVILFANHPNINAFHTGFAGWLVSIIFLVSTIVGARVNRLFIVALLLFLAFAEPELTITRTLKFNIVSNGLVLGAGTSWLLSRPRFTISSLPIMGALAGIGAMTVLIPAIYSSVQWIHIHDALMFMKYMLVFALAVSVKPSPKMWLILAGSLAIGSLAVAIFAIIQTFHIPVISGWMFNTYLASWNFTEEEFANLAVTYTRAYGVDGPTGSAVLLALSIGAWLTLLLKSNTLNRTIAASVGSSIVLIGIYVMGSRIGFMVTIPVLVLGYVWLKNARRDRQMLKVFSITFALAILTVAAVANMNYSFGETIHTANGRLVHTIPNLLRGTPDISVRDRLDEYALLSTESFELTGVRNTLWSSEYIVILYRFGLAGFLLTWLLWSMLLVRGIRASQQAFVESDRLIGFIGVVTVLATVIAATGIPSLLEPSRMVVTIIVIGLAPAVRVYATSSEPAVARATVEPTVTALS